MTVAALLCVIGIFTWCQPSAARRKAALIFIVPTVIHSLASGSLSDRWYYLSAALTDSFAIILLSCLVAVDKLTVRLMIFSALSMCLNLVGLIMYEMYQPATIYDALFIALYAGVIIALADQEGSNVGMGRTDKLRPGRLRNGGASVRISHQGDQTL